MSKKEKYYFVVTKKRYVIHWFDLLPNFFAIILVLVFIYSLNLTFFYFPLFIFSFVFLVMKFSENFNIRKDYAFFHLRNIKFIDVISENELPKNIFDLKYCLAYSDGSHIYRFL